MEEVILQAILKSLAGGGDTQGITAFSPKNVLKNLGKKSDEEVEYYVTDMVGDIRIRSFINQEVVHEDRRNL